MADDPLRYAREHEQLHSAFGTDRFGEIAERVARFFGTPQYILGQSALSEKVKELTEEVSRLTKSIHARVVGA